MTCKNELKKCHKHFSRVLVYTEGINPCVIQHMTAAVSFKNVIIAGKQASFIAFHHMVYLNVGNSCRINH